MDNAEHPVQITIEYCTACNFRSECYDLKKFIELSYPKAKVECRSGRKGSFEVVINDTLVHSKLSTMSFPTSEDVIENIHQASQGKPLRKCTEQPITDCVLQ